MRRFVVLYHASCWDGFCAAWVMRKFYYAEHRLRGWYDAQFIPVQHGQPLPTDLQQNDDVFIVDFSYPAETLLLIADRVSSLTVIDHHKSARFLTEFDSEEVDVFFNEERSGAALAWEYLTRQSSLYRGVQIPDLVLYVEDRDLWKHELEDTKEINAWLRSYPFKMELWDTFESLIRKGSGLRDTCVKEGKAILRARDIVVSSAASHAVRTYLEVPDLPPLEIMAVNETYYQSEVGSLLTNRPENPDIAVMYFDLPNGGTVFSLRRSDDSDVDLSLIAKKFGGGGHPGAAGFSIPYHQESPVRLVV